MNAPVEEAAISWDSLPLASRGGWWRGGEGGTLSQLLRLHQLFQQQKSSII